MNRVTQFMLLRLASVPEQEFLRHIHAAPRVGTSLPFVADHVAQRALAPPSLCVRARGASGVLPAFGYHGRLCCGHRRAVWVDAWEWNYGTLQQLWVRLLRNHQIVLHTGAPFYIFRAVYQGSTFSTSALRRFSLFLFVAAILQGMKQYLEVVLICICPMTNGIEHCLMCLLATCVSLKKFKSPACF